MGQDILAPHPSWSDQKWLASMAWSDYKKIKKKKNLFSSGFEPETFRVLGGCDNQLHHENAYRIMLDFSNLYQELDSFAIF